MHPYSKMAENLKKCGYPQELTVGNNIYLKKSDQYMEFRGKLPDEPYILVPKLENLINRLADIKYEIKHDIDSSGQENWTVIYEDGLFTVDNLWMAMAQFWIDEKGVV